MFNLYAAHRISPRFARASCVATTCPAHVSRKTCSSRCDEPTRNTMTHAYPLAWPAGWPRTAQTQRRRARYHVSLARARDDLLQELQRLGASGTLISTDLPLRRDGLPLASAREPMDLGLAVHALRQLERTGASGILERAFGGFQGLPPPRAEDAPPPWRDLLDMGNDLSDPPAVLLARAERRFRILAQDHHPDRGGDSEWFQRLLRARDAARRELGGS